MSSREIAELTGKQHKNVLRDVKRMLEDLDDAGLNSELGSYRDENKQERPEYRLPKDLSICLVAGYDAKLRLTIIRRWDELEKAAAAEPQVAAFQGNLDDTLAPRIATLTMTSREIADLLGNRHDNVVRTIERLEKAGVIMSPPLEETLVEMPNGGHKSAQVYFLDRRSSIIVVAQLSPEFTAAIVDRWDELERRAQAGTLADPSAPRLAAMEAAIMDLTRLVGELVSRPAQVALPAPVKGPKLISAARFITKTYGIGDPSQVSP